MKRSDLDKSSLKLLYASGLSAQQIADQNSVGIWKIYYLLRRYRIARRSPAETNHIRFVMKPLSFAPLRRLTKEQQLLRVAGLVLYWAEGYKRAIWTIDFANSDPESVKVFLKFLREIYRVTEQRLRMSIYCYSNQSVKALTSYWSGLTNIPLNQFTKPFVRKDYRLEKTGRMPYGLVHIRYSDKRLLERLLGDIRTLQAEILAGYPSGQRGVAVISSFSRKLELKN